LVILTGYTTASPAPANIREVDFSNFTYQYQKENFQVINGEYTGNYSKDDPPESFIVVAIQYGDLTGDGKEEAVILTQYNGGGSGSFENFYIYTLRDGQIVLLDQMEGGDRAGGGNKAFYIEDGNLYLINYDRGQNVCAACYDWERTHVLKWNGSKFVEVLKSDPQPVRDMGGAPEDSEEPQDLDQALEAMAVMAEDASDSESEEGVDSLQALIAQRIDTTENPRLVQLLIETLNNQNESINIRSEAALALAGLKDQRALEPLIQALKDKNSRLRSNAVLALGELGSARAVSALIPLLQEADTQVRMNAIWALSEIRDAQASEPILRATKQALQKKEWKVAGEGIQALGKIKDPHSVELLLEALEAKDADVRMETAWALGEIGDEQAITHLKQALNGESKEYVKSDIDVALTKLESRHGLRISEFSKLSHVRVR
jgi:HEAT repeat protein